MNKKIEVTSKQFWLNSKDFLRGLIMAMGTTALMVVQNSIDAGQIVFHWKQMLMAGVGGGVTYLLKNFFQPAQIKKDVTPDEIDALKTSDNKAAK